MSDKNQAKRAHRQYRHRSIRKKIRGTSECPRLSVFRSARHIYAQLIDDLSGTTLVAISSMSPGIQETVKSEKDSVVPIIIGKYVGTKIAELANEKGITKVKFDRGGNLFHGRIKALADAAREGGLKF